MSSILAREGEREQWHSRLGFIMATVGSAVGLGNVWRFPTMVVRGGGGAFLLMYLGLVLLIGIPAILMELALGRRTHRNVVTAFSTIKPGTRWWAVGAASMVAVFIILSFYSVIAGWSLIYMIGSAAGMFSGLEAPSLTAAFLRLSSHPSLPVTAAALFVTLTALVVASGVARGIEKISKILMPGLFVLLVVLVLRSLTLDGALSGLAWFFRPNPEALTLDTALSAMGQVFFSFSLGMGAVITYGSYLSSRENIPQSGLIIGFADVGIAILAGLVVVPALFAFGVSPEIGPGIIFVTLPAIFNTMPGSVMWSTLFFLMLTFAALTSTIAMLEVLVSYFVDERGWKRPHAALLLGVLTFTASIPSALATGLLAPVRFGGLNILDAADTLASNLLLPGAGVFTALFVGWAWGTGPALSELRQGAPGFRWERPLAFTVKYVIPAALAYILVSGLIL